MKVSVRRQKLLRDLTLKAQKIMLSYKENLRQCGGSQVTMSSFPLPF